MTDSQAFLKVAADTPPGVPLTSFSILFARFQGDLTEMVRGTLGIERLKAGDRVLVAESCTHHPIGEDIGRVKIPRWLRQYTGLPLDVRPRPGARLPRRPLPLLSRRPLRQLHGQPPRDALPHPPLPDGGVPITNYGLTIAYSLGILERALGPFPAALEAFRESRAKAEIPVEVTT